MGRSLNYFENFLVLVSVIRVFVSVSAFDSFVSFPVGIASSVLELDFCALTAGIKNYK